MTMTPERYHNEEYARTIEMGEQTGIVCRRLFVDGLVLSCTKAARNPVGR